MVMVLNKYLILMRIRSITTIGDMMDIVDKITKNERIRRSVGKSRVRTMYR